MKKSLKTVQIADAYQLIEKASYQSLQDEDKVKLWKISRQLKPTATQFLSDKADAIRSFITPEFQEAFQKARLFEMKREKGEELPMSQEEYLACGKVITDTDKLMEAAIGEFANKEVELDFEPLSEDALGMLITSNNWEFSKTDLLEWMTEKK